jgi:hypothetical protein
MGYDLKAGFILRGSGADRAFELEVTILAWNKDGRMLNSPG